MTHFTIRMAVSIYLRGRVQVSEVEILSNVGGSKLYYDFLRKLGVPALVIALPPTLSS